MLHIYNAWHAEIDRAVLGTDISAAYLAALISLESSPPGNPHSKRFEPRVYERLLELKHAGRAWGGLKQNDLRRYSDAELKQLATSYGLTQIMGYHCLSLGCTIEELRGEYHLQWAAAYMQFHYGKVAKKRDWPACFRIHNTGRPDGSTHREDYVERGMVRMEYYRKWAKSEGGGILPFSSRDETDESDQNNARENVRDAESRNDANHPGVDPNDRPDDDFGAPSDAASPGRPRSLLDSAL